MPPGVIGPTRINYGRIIPVVDYTRADVGLMRFGGGGVQPGRDLINTCAIICAPLNESGRLPLG